MTDERPPGASDDPGPTSVPQPTGAPRWAKAFGIIGLLVVAIVITVLIAGGGQHGPGRHVPDGDSSGVGAPGDRTSDDEPRGDGHAPPEGGHG